jgi:structural maintenance of chromosome 2
MYQNANVLFKVQFLDGVSKIDRFALKDKKNPQKLTQQQRKKM